ncbi:hypothetical protein [Pontibacillus chungwhensis]|uniref:hypothetical protein n=1 Tax=Pontibacillus chungwhensis TaxID=265426 RepID=UPI0012EBEF95|nr:hypothetical protein [Pontibacillus chungwhensis]
MALLYIAIIFITPFIIRFTGNTTFSSQPEWMNAKLYSIQVTGNEYHSKATMLGLVISVLIGTGFYYIADRISARRQGRDNK